MRGQRISRPWLMLALATCALGEPAASLEVEPTAQAAPPSPPAPAAARCDGLWGLPADQPPAPAPWSFVVISDLHQPDNARPSRSLGALVAAVLAEQPRFVVIAGDSTNGNPGDSPGRVQAMRASWRALLAQLEPLHTAGIAVLPVAGNHDAQLPGHRVAYAEAFADLERWAQPLAIDGAHQASPRGDGVALDAAPFSYSVRIDGVHLSLAHIVDQHLRPEVARWLADDLARARDATMRIVIGHVPVSSVMTRPNPAFVGALGGVLASGGATAYIAGHEHLVWDEVVAVPGGELRQILVGTGIGTYNYGPSASAMKRASCEAVHTGGDRYRCWLPQSGVGFTLHDSRSDGHRLIQHARQSYTVFTVDGSTLTARPVELTGSGERLAFAAMPAFDQRQ